MLSRVLALATIGALSVLADCGSSQQFPTSENTSSSVLPSPMRYPTQSQLWGVGADGSAYSQPHYIFQYCDTKVSLEPSSSDICTGPPYEYGKSRMNVSYNSGGVPCNFGSYDGTCSASLATNVKLGTMSLNASASESPANGADASISTSQDSAFVDEVTVTSSTLPYGTAVKLKATVQVSASVDTDCSSNGAYYSLQWGNALVQGYCDNGQFLRDPAGGKSTWKFSQKVGDTFGIQTHLVASLSVDACIGRNASGYCIFGPNSASAQVSRATFHLIAITPNVALVTASGTTY